ncbi:DEAD/DEAH box helicase family protein [Lutibacter sp. B2]|nr:DEAD/DEAH box helicase family protein [Lutibacter sp. B2]
MKIIDNIQNLLGEDLKSEINKKSKISIAASYFSIYAFEALKKELKDIEELRFIFTSPTFISDQIKKEKREFYIPKANREKSLYGSEFEIKLKNELTQKAIAKECSEWIRKKVKFKSNKTSGAMHGMVNVNNGEDKITYMPIHGFTTVDLGYEKGNNIGNMVSKFDDFSMSKSFFDLFEQVWSDEEKLEDVTDEIMEHISSVYKENSPEFMYFITLYNIFNSFLEDIAEELLPNDATGFKNTEVWKRLYNFQKDAVVGSINKLEKYNGCILADSVGLGKTFSALGVIKYYELRNKDVLVLCPKKLSDNWMTYRQKVSNNILAPDRFRYDVLYHTDISREKGMSNGIPLDRLNWGNYDLIVIDESHNFRNNEKQKNKENRYQKLMRKVIKDGVKTKVLMLSATPVNNKFSDLRNQLALAYEGETENINEKLNTEKDVNDIFKRAQAGFNKWSKFKVNERTTEKLLDILDFDFFELLDSVTIARSRNHIQKYYDMKDIGTFPIRRKPMSHFCDITDKNDVIGYNDIFKELSNLSLAMYAPFKYILPSKINFYDQLYDTVVGGNRSKFKQADREMSLQFLMRVNLLKRLESSVDAFRLTLTKMIYKLDNILEHIEKFEESGKESVVDYREIEDTDFDNDSWLDEEHSIGNKVKINIADIDRIAWKEELDNDRDILNLLLDEMKKVVPDEDQKLNKLKEIIKNKIENPINEGNKKVIIFTAFADTASYLYENISTYAKQSFDIETAKIVGSDANKITIKISSDLNSILTCFSPGSKEKHLTMPDVEGEIDILIATDCISEGQNLQDCDFLVNYDIHWNPVRIIQRFGRIDRIGSKNTSIQLVNFWPNMSLDEYIKLKDRVESRMIIMDMTATGEDNVLLNKSNDLEYRKTQLKRLQEEVIDLDEMNTGVSITDLGLNDFKMDLANYIKENGEIKQVPFGLHAVAKADPIKGIYPGVIYVLKNINNEINIDNRNRLHPFYLVYLDDGGDVITTHLEVKKTLDILRAACRGESEPIKEVCKLFNQETKDGRKMDQYSMLLEESIKSIINVKEESDIDSLFSIGGTTALLSMIKGIEDFELISFLVIR